ncbi:MAG: haloacid dehalogenase-like hydrolase, partial [Opitutales bacterium]|nr:haloacid dehalogenase-like hydrolase [Opitutales bacterium]
MAQETLHAPNIIACLWDFDKTLIPGYMQTPVFRHFDVDEQQFWDEVNVLPERYEERGQTVSRDTIYL